MHSLWTLSKHVLRCCRHLDGLKNSMTGMVEEGACLSRRLGRHLGHMRGEGQAGSGSGRCAGPPQRAGVRARPLVLGRRRAEVCVLQGPLGRPVDLAGCKALADGGRSACAAASRPCGLRRSLTVLHMCTPLMQWELLPNCASITAETEQFSNIYVAGNPLLAKHLQKLLLPESDPPPKSSARSMQRCHTCKLLDVPWQALCMRVYTHLSGAPCCLNLHLSGEGLAPPLLQALVELCKLHAQEHDSIRQLHESLSLRAKVPTPLHNSSCYGVFQHHLPAVVQYLPTEQASMHRDTLR